SRSLARNPFVSPEFSLTKEPLFSISIYATTPINCSLRWEIFETPACRDSCKPAAPSLAVLPAFIARSTFKTQRFPREPRSCKLRFPNRNATCLIVLMAHPGNTGFVIGVPVTGRGNPSSRR
ncbi:hypothetical protein ACIP1U_24940, partial [Cupriavidus sp. NPDC089707]|uniref:hypothetical protein n=1 Tax=Cupriavidus sp. NPDC089707 TaxID=3363963 RepID=UPI00381F7CAF